MRQRTIRTRVGQRAPLPDITINNRESPTPQPPPEPPPHEPRWPGPDTPAANCVQQRVTSTCTNPCAPSPETTTHSRENPTPPPLPEPPPPEPCRSRTDTSATTDTWQSATNTCTDSRASPQQPTTTHSSDVLPPPEPMTMTTSSSSNRYSDSNDSNGCYRGRSISWGDEGSQQTTEWRSSQRHQLQGRQLPWQLRAQLRQLSQQSATTAHAQPPTPLPPPPAKPPLAASIYRVNI